MFQYNFGTTKMIEKQTTRRRKERYNVFSFLLIILRESIDKVKIDISIMYLLLSLQYLREQT